MIDRSLFPNLVPDKASEDRWRPPCCEGLKAPPGVDLRTWTFIHAVGHSRVPFTVAAFADVAECTAHQATVCIRHAGQHGWIDPVIPEHYMTAPTPQWVGCLPRRR